MMGPAHALSGMAAWGVGAPAVAAFVNNIPSLPLVGQPPAFNLTFGTWLLGMVVCAGAALAPDLDHPERSSASNSLGVVTNTLSRFLELISGGHRKGTHSFVGIAFFTALVVLSMQFLAPWGPLLVVFLLSAFTANALDLDKVLPQLPGLPARIVLAGLCTVAAHTLSGGDYGWLMYAMMFGTFLHIVGDFITIGGVPWLWPIMQRTWHILPLRAGGTVENWVITPLLILTLGYALWNGVANREVLDHPVETTRVSAQAR